MKWGVGNSAKRFLQLPLKQMLAWQDSVSVL